MFPEETVDAAMAELLILAVFDTINSLDALRGDSRDELPSW
jgi:hypothetical protein